MRTTICVTDKEARGWRSRASDAAVGTAGGGGGAPRQRARLHRGPAGRVRSLALLPPARAPSCRRSPQKEGGREDGREGGREGGREEGREGGREGGREEGREGWREGVLSQEI